MPTPRLSTYVVRLRRRLWTPPTDGALAWSTTLLPAPPRWCAWWSGRWRTLVFYVSADGRRSVVVTMSQSAFFASGWDPAPAFEAFARLVDQAQCGRLVG
ncbi:MAG TPA: hypothetical protein VI076_01850 [Actinopolymorphaceae bacterium]